MRRCGVFAPLSCYALTWSAIVGSISCNRPMRIAITSLAYTAVLNHACGRPRYSEVRLYLYMNDIFHVCVTARDVDPAATGATLPAVHAAGVPATAAASTTAAHTAAGHGRHSNGRHGNDALQHAVRHSSPTQRRCHQHD